jgi:type I restriction enzyme M protein
MLTNEIRNQIDQIWNAFWSGGISNPLEVIEQITYLLFIKPLDELQTLEELKALRLKKPIERRLFPRAMMIILARLVPTKIIAGHALRTSWPPRCTRS